MHRFSHLVTVALILRAQSLTTSKPELNRRESLQKIVGNSFTFIGTAPLLFPSISNGITTDDAGEGLSAVTDSSIGKAFRRSVVQGARVADSLDEKWESLSDSLRDKSKCDKVTGRRLYDNGVRKDGTPIGNPGLGALCNPEPLLPLDDGMADKILDLAVESALVAVASGAGKDSLSKVIQQTKDLVRPSFERSIQNTSSEDEKKKGQFSFEMYYTLRAISTFLKENNVSSKVFQIAWGEKLVSMYAPNASRRDYLSPFPVKDDEFQDYDYDKNLLLDALGKLKVVLDKLKSGGLIGYYEISIPYDDYGSVVTVALDDYVPIGAEILLSEQNFKCAGPVQAVLRNLFDKARINFSLDTFYIDPSTTRQSDYNPTQLLLSLNGLSKM